MEKYQMLAGEYECWEENGTIPPNDGELTWRLHNLKNALGSERYSELEPEVTQYAAACERHAFYSGFCRALTLCMEARAYPWL